MKKIMAMVLIVLVAGTMLSYAMPDSSGGVGDIMGQGKFPSDPHKIFRLVRYVPSDGTDISLTLTVDCIVIWDTNSDDGVTVTTTATSPDSAVAGIMAVQALTPEANTNGWSAAASVGRRNWSWLQTYGKSEVRVNGNNKVVAGDAMGTSAVLGDADIFVASTSASEKNGNAGFFYDSAAAGTHDVECFVRCD